MLKSKISSFDVVHFSEQTLQKNNHKFTFSLITHKNSSWIIGKRFLM